MFREGIGVLEVELVRPSRREVEVVERIAVRGIDIDEIGPRRREIDPLAGAGCGPANTLP